MAAKKTAHNRSARQAPGRQARESEYDDTNTIVIFATSKQTMAENPKRPVLWGRVNIDGEPYRVALWKREGQKGPFWSGNIEPDDEAPAKGKAGGEDDPDLPF